MNETVNYGNFSAQGACLFYLDRRRIVCAERLGPQTFISRAAENSNAGIQLLSSYVSAPVHGEIRCSAGNYYYIDQNSTNGTIINGRMIHGPQTPVQLSDGDVMRVGTMRGNAKDNVVMLFSSSSDHSAHWNKFKPDRELDHFSIGRQTSSAQDRIIIASPDVSRLHCVFTRSGDGWVITNKSTTNPVKVNGALLSNSTLLQPLDVIKIASGYIIYDGEWFHIQARSSAPANRGFGQTAALRVKINRRMVRVHGTQKTILRDINVDIPNGAFVLILGGSGAGKTTFMNAVMGYEPAEGTVMLDNIDIYRNYKQVKRLIGFVPQQNLIREKDIVYNTLEDAAKMKRGGACPPQTIKQIVDKTLVMFGLMELKNNLVSTLSGGQIRRLSIATEYVGDPRAFFLDEPDSGLDYANTRVLLESLRTVADQGKIVMLISHSPDRGRDMYDKVVVLSKSTTDNSGHLAFYGGVNEACSFFGVNTLEEILVQINSREEGGQGKSDFYINKFRSSKF